MSYKSLNGGLKNRMRRAGRSVKSSQKRGKAVRSRGPS